MTTAYRIKQLSQLAGVSVRTLHYYDEIGLLQPSARSTSGYRLYSVSDALRLQQIMLGREFGMPLADIACMLNDPQFDMRSALEKQRMELQNRARQTEALLHAVDVALAMLTRSSGGNMGQVFEGFDPAKYEMEAQQKWGETESWKQYATRSPHYTPEDWKQINAAQGEIYRELAALLKQGCVASDDAVGALVERHRSLIDRWFYPCDAKMHRHLADMYENDPRFAHNIDRHGEGTCRLLVAAIRLR